MMKAGREYCCREQRKSFYRLLFTSRFKKKRQGMERADRRDPAKVAQGPGAMLKLGVKGSESLLHDGRLRKTFPF